MICICMLMQDLAHGNTKRLKLEPGTVNTACVTSLQQPLGELNVRFILHFSILDCILQRIQLNMIQ